MYCLRGMASNVDPEMSHVLLASDRPVWVLGTLRINALFSRGLKLSRYIECILCGP